MVLLKFLLPAFFILFALGETLRFRFYSSAAIGLMDIVLFTIVLIWIFFVKKNNYRLKKPIGFFILFAFLSLILNFFRFPFGEIMVSSMYLFRFIFYALLYFVIIDLSKEFGKKIPAYMTVSGIIVIFAGYLQYLLYPSLKNLYYLGFDEHMHRLFSTFLDPNFAGTFLVLFFVFVFVLRDKLFPKKYKYIPYVILIFNFLAIVLTYSRGALLMFLVCTIIYSALVKNWKLTAGIVGLFAAIFLVLSPLYYIENTNLLRFASVEARIDSTKTALEIFKKNPMGVGFNTYRYAREQYGDIDESRYGPSHSGAGVDNSFVLVLVTTGVIGFASYIYMLYSIFRLGFRNIKSNPYATILIVSMGGLLVNALFINSLFYGFIMIWMWALVSLTENS